MCPHAAQLPLDPQMEEVSIVLGCREWDDTKRAAPLVRAAGGRRTVCGRSGGSRIASGHPYRVPSTEGMTAACTPSDPSLRNTLLSEGLGCGEGQTDGRATAASLYAGNQRQQADGPFWCPRQQRMPAHQMTAGLMLRPAMLHVSALQGSVSSPGRCARLVHAIPSARLPV
ncbi:hypothetical protein BS50DRAFT_304778 [Corynespora cassiicola Philippines]|uniref:Uncharacterized protein n=1 Tax=Corynespora cassiicola Philippines TaxID=1448308 RepID=A0A2T2NXK1_CORCC|nr:hypothetical protein BS50DRAFT_304778 [Corynespora cassiicola Philippines]